MVTVRSIITEALNRSNLVSRRQTAPADMVETGFRLLKGICAKYSDDNLLQFIVSDVSTTLDRQEFVLGEIDPDAPEQYLEVTVPAPRIQKVNKVYWRSKAPQDPGTFMELQFASPSDFDAYPVGSGVYTAQPINDLQVVLKTKLYPDERTEIKISYNKKWHIGLDDELRIPDQYIELFTTSLTYKLALTFPRLSSEQVNLLKEDLKEQEAGVRVSTRAIKYVSRTRVPAINRASFYSGTMFFGG